MNKGLVALLAAGGVAYLVSANRNKNQQNLDIEFTKKKKKKKKKKGKNKSKKISRKAKVLLVEEDELTDYKLDGRLNKHERLFAEYLKEIKLRIPKNYPIKIKQREPVLIEEEGEDYLQHAYITKQQNGITYIVTPKIYNNKRLNYAIHELCHLKDAHHDPERAGFYASNREKEYDVEECVKTFFELNELNYEPHKRTKEDIDAAYN